MRLFAGLQYQIILDVFILSLTPYRFRVRSSARTNIHFNRWELKAKCIQVHCNLSATNEIIGWFSECSVIPHPRFRRLRKHFVFGSHSKHLMCVNCVAWNNSRKYFENSSSPMMMMTIMLSRLIKSPKQNMETERKRELCDWIWKKARTTFTRITWLLQMWRFMRLKFGNFLYRSVYPLIVNYITNWYASFGNHPVM